MPVQLQRRLSLRTCRRNTRTRKRPKDLYTPILSSKISSPSFRREQICIFQGSETYKREIFLSKNFADKEKRILEQEEIKQIVLLRSLSLSRPPSPLFSFLISYRSMADEKSATEKRLVMERLEIPNFIENFAGYLSRILRVLRLVCQEFVRIHVPEIDSKHDIAESFRKFDMWSMEFESMTCIFKKAIL